MPSMARISCGLRPWAAAIGTVLRRPAGRAARPWSSPDAVGEYDPVSLGPVSLGDGHEVRSHPRGDVMERGDRHDRLRSTAAQE
jgi:hypothetical protein